MTALPEGWAKARAGDVLNLVNGFAFSRSQWSEAGKPIIRIQNLNNASARFNYFDGDLPQKFLVRPRDLLFAWSGTPGTSFGAHIWDGPPAWLNQHIFRVEFDQGIFEKRFLQLAINQNLAEYIEKAHGGAGLAHITKRKFDDSMLVLPPLDEQRRIAEKVDDLLDVLARAMDRAVTVGTKARVTKEVAIRALTDLENTPCMPLSELGRWVSGGTPTRSRAEYWDGGAVPWISPKDMKREFLFDSQEHVTQRSIDTGAARLLPPGCVLVVVRGMILAHSFPVALNRVPVAVNQDIRALVPGPGVEADFVLRTLQAKRIEILERVKESTHGTRRLESHDLFSIEVPLPESRIQRKIAQRIAEVLDKTDRVETRVASSIARMELIRQSILSRAFAGDLVPTEAQLARREGRSYEPASALIARIRAAREDHLPSARRTHRGKAITRAPKENAAMTKTRYDDDVRGKPYLARLLRELGGIGDVHDLFKRADLNVVDFYKQLAWEVDCGHIDATAQNLEAGDASR